MFAKSAFVVFGALRIKWPLCLHLLIMIPFVVEDVP